MPTPLKTRITILIIICITGLNISYSQSEICDTSLPNISLSNLDGLTGSMPQLNPFDEPAPFCDGTGNPQNMTWFKFIAETSSAVVNITFTNCEGGGQLNQIQYGVYTDCTFTEYLPSACQGTPIPTQSPVTIILTDMIPKEDYYLFIDGDLGTYCDYSFEVISPAQPDDIDCISDNCNNNGILCTINDTLTFKTVVIESEAQYTWTALPGPPLGPESVITTENEVDLVFSNSGEYTISVMITTEDQQILPTPYELSVFPDEDNDDVCDAEDACPNGPEPGTPCDDGDETTINDTISTNCICIGEDPNIVTESNTEINIFPNPFTDIITIQYPYAANYRVLSLHGDIIIEGKIEQKNSINLSTIDSGVYIISIHSKTKTETYRIVKA